MTVLTLMSVARSMSRTSPSVAVVDRVGGHAGPVRADAGHHHHVVGDGLHHGHRGRPREPVAAVAQRHQVGRQALVDLVGTAAVDDQDVGAALREARLALLRRGRATGRPRSRAGRRRTGGAEHRAPTGRDLGEALGERAVRPRRRWSSHIRSPPARRPRAAAGAGVRGHRPRPGDRGVLVGAVADDEPVHLGALAGDVEDREAVVVEVEVLDVAGCWPGSPARPPGSPCAAARRGCP